MKGLAAQNFVFSYFNLIVPSSTPTNIAVNRSENGSILTVSWRPLSLEDVGGFYKSYLVLSNIEQDKILFSKNVPYTNSSTVFVGLDPSTRYLLTITVITIDSTGRETEGQSSEPLEIADIPSDG